MWGSLGGSKGESASERAEANVGVQSLAIVATVPSSFEYSRPVWGPRVDEEPPDCPHCKQQIQEGDNVHWWDDTLWHTKPCP